MLRELLAKIKAVASRLAGGAGAAQPQRRNKPKRGKKRFGPFSDRRSRRKNVEAVVARWATAAKGSGSPSDSRLTLPYRRAESLLTQGERAFGVPLYQAVNGRYRIFCKVRLADVVCCPSDEADERNWFAKISAYHVDFVLCDPESTRPLLAIELDDRSHHEDGQVRVDRDKWKSDVLLAAGLPLYRIRAQQAYDVIELERAIDHLMSKLFVPLSGEIP